MTMRRYEAHDYFEFYRPFEAGKLQIATVGYIVIPKSHPWYGLSRDEINETFPSGGTQAMFAEAFSGKWVVGCKLPGGLSVENIKKIHEYFTIVADGIGSKRYRLEILRQELSIVGIGLY